MEATYTERELNLGRLAAYIDGEGSIVLSRNTMGKRPGHHYCLEVSVYNTDPRLCMWCKEQFGGAVKRHNRHVKVGKPMWKWFVTGRKNSLPILESCLPFFVIKRDQAELGIAFGKTFSRANNKGGAKYQPVVKYREMLREKIVAIRKTQHEAPDSRSAGRLENVS